MTAQHTPGPWKIHDGGRFGQYGDLGPSICHPTSESNCQPLFEIVGPANIEECQANAVLVESAPDLLEAAINAKAVLKVRFQGRGSKAETNAYLVLCRTIAKATGGKP